MLEEFVASFAGEEEKGGSKAFVRGETFVPHTVTDRSVATATESTGKLYKPAPKIKAAAPPKEEPPAPAADASSKGGSRSIDELKQMFMKYVSRNNHTSPLMSL